MKNKKNNKRYVAHFDMLGFKNAVLRNLDEAWGALSDFQMCIRKLMTYGIKIISTGEVILGRTKVHLFSDSVLLYTVRDEPQDLISILVLSSQLFADNLHTRVPLRGGISHGDFLFNEEIPNLPLFCGAPLIRAHAIGEMAQWLGIVVDDMVVELYQKHSASLTSYGLPNLIQWDVPVKSENKIKLWLPFQRKSKKKLWVVNWPVIFKGNFTEKPPISIQDYYVAFESLFGPYEKLPQNVKAKYKNTVNFINSNLTPEN